MNVAEAIARAFADRGITQCFAVAGGHSVFLLDALTREPRIRTIFTHHENAAAMAADGYARIAGKPAVVCISAGPAAMNALNGVWGAYVDSVPMVVLSGAPRRETLATFEDLTGVRQIGDQECDITALAGKQKLTKRARTVWSPDNAAEQVSLAVEVAIAGRPGPCWLEVPVDVQATTVMPATWDADDGWQRSERPNGSRRMRSCR